MELEHGSDFTCPACKRPGLWVHQVASHIPFCPCHPATMKERETDTLLEFAVAVLREKRPSKSLPEVRLRKALPIQRFWPSAWSDQDPGMARATRDPIKSKLEKVEFLLVSSRRAEYPTIVKRYADDVASTLSSWQRHRGARESACPYCETDSRFLALFAHMAECPDHPAFSRAKTNEAMLIELGAERLDGLGRINREADLARVAIARLAEFASSFMGSFGDDERGRGIIYEALIPKWDHEVELARTTLKSLLNEAETSPPARLKAISQEQTMGEMSVETYDSKMKDLTDFFYKHVTKDGGIFLIDMYPYCRAQVSFFSAVAEAGMVDAPAADTLACETQQALNEFALENDDGGIGGQIKKMLRGLDTLKEAAAKARAIASKATAKPSREDVYSLCSGLVHHFIEE